MAIVVQSTATASDSSSPTGVTITKPTGLALDDLMVAVIGAYGSNITTIDTLGGWTRASGQPSTIGDVEIQYKVADSGDVAASNFTFTISSGAGGLVGGTIMRVSGTPTSSILDANDSDFAGSASSATISAATTASPSDDGYLIVTGFTCTDTGNTGTIGTYVASDGSLSWTELYDLTANAGSEDPIMGAAYAIQSTATALTTYGATLSTPKTAHRSCLAIFKASKNENGTVALHEVSPSFFAPTASAGTNGTVALHEVSPTIPLQSGDSTAPPVWTNPDKPSTEWTNPDKD